MNIDTHGVDERGSEPKVWTYVVTLSEKNLADLVWQADYADSAVMPATIRRRMSDGALLLITVEPDEAHYNKPERIEQMKAAGLL